MDHIYFLLKINHELFYLVSNLAMQNLNPNYNKMLFLSIIIDLSIDIDHIVA